MEPRTKKLVGWSIVGVAVVMLMIVAAGLAMFDTALKDMRMSAVRNAPEGWLDSLRTVGRAPDALRELDGGPKRPGDAAELAWDSSLSSFRTEWRSHANRFDRFARGEAAREDTLALRDLAADTSLNRWAALAMRENWNILPEMQARTDSADREVMFLLRSPNYMVVSSLAGALGARGTGRALRGDRTAARADFDAALHLGALMVQRDPTVIGFMVGRRALQRGAAGLAWLGSTGRDTVLARRAAEVRDWSNRRQSYTGLLRYDYESALVIAADTTLAPGLRAAGLEGMIGARMARAWALTVGAPRSLEQALLAVPTGGDAAFAPMPALAASTLRRINSMGPKARLNSLTAF